MAAHFIIEEVDTYAFFCLGDQQVLEALPEVVVVYDEELDKQVSFGLCDGLEDCIEGRLAIDEQFQFVATQKWGLGKCFKGSVWHLGLVVRIVCACRENGAFVSDEFLESFFS